MMVTISLSEAVRKELEGCLDDSPIVVWYDEEGTLEPVLNECVPEGVELTKYSGSYLRIRVSI